MQKRNGRPCGKVPVRLIKWSVFHYSPEPSVIGVTLQWGERENDSNDLLSSFIFSSFFSFLFHYEGRLLR